MTDPSPRRPAAAFVYSPEQRAAESGWLLLVAQRSAAASQAMRRLSEAYESRILGFCLRRGMSLADAEDLLQDVCVRIYAKAGDFRQGESPSGWIWAIARNRWVDALRELYKKRAESGGEDVESLSEASEQVAAVQSAVPAQATDGCVRRGLQSFARAYPDEAMVVELRDLEGWAIKDVAEFLKRSEGATRQFLCEVRKKLKPFLAPCLELLAR